MEKFNNYQKELLNRSAVTLEQYYPDGESLERYLIAESKTGNSNSTLALFALPTGNVVLPITTRKYNNRTVSQLYHSEFFKVQYTNIASASLIKDLINPSTLWKPVLLNNSRAILTIDSSIDCYSILNSKRDIRHHIRKHGLRETNELTDEKLVQITIDRFNLKNLGATIDECIESDFYKSKCDSTRRYYTLSNKNDEHKAIVELQIEEKNDALTVHYINAYYDQDAKFKYEKVGLQCYYNVVQLASNIAKELGYKTVTIDFGVIFNYEYKLKIPGTVLGGTTMIFTRL